MTKQEAKQQIQKLIDKYKRIEDADDLNSYNEARTRNEFIEPLFEFLGWDMRNLNNANEVIPEESSSGGRIDLAFRINNIPVMFLEAKALGKNLDDPQWAEQVINYSWNKGVTWAVLTDFETIKVFNAETPPKDPEKNKFLELSWQSYISDFDDLWMLSKEGFSQGLLAKKAEKYGGLVKRKPVGDKLFEDLTAWRALLTKSVGRSNKLSEEELDHGIQKILDRLVFIRTAEDRKLEANVLQSILHSWESRGQKGNLYEQLVSTFRNFDEGYDSTLFGPHNSEKWEINNDAIAQVINGLYKTKDGYRYDFAAISVDVLGSIYQHYLGYVQQKSKKGAEIAESKKRKKQGIFYTPRYIADFIVKETLGEVLKKTKPKDISKIKVLDPACGSGSFLTAAYDKFISYYEKQKRPKDQINLFTKLDILKNNLYGVDLDAQAVEIAQLNLLLKVLFQRGERLPDLQHNIRNGNSLISGEEISLKPYFGDNWRDQKPFNWEEEFKEVFDQGGFDVVIGNPPYVNLANIEDKNFREYLKKEFKTAKNKSDLYSFFIERALGLLRGGGLLGFIVSNSWLGTDSFSKFRKFLIENTTVLKLVKLHLGVFKDAVVTPVLIIIKKELAKSNHEIELIEFDKDEFKELPHTLPYKRIVNSPSFNFSFNPDINFRVPIIKLGEVAKFSMGVKTSDNERFILDTKKDESCYKLLRGKDVWRYRYKYAGKWIWYKPDLMMKKVGAGPRKPEYFLKDKILFREITGGSVIAVLDSDKHFTNNKVHILHELNGFSMEFILGLVNSKLVNFWIKSKFGNLLQLEINQLQEIPIPKLDFSELENNRSQKTLIDLVRNILRLNKELQEHSGSKGTAIRNEIAKLDHQIDQEVYKLYGLTDEEIKTIEQK